MTQVNTKYETEANAIHPIRVDNVTFAVITADVPAGAVTNRISAKVSRGKNEFGLKPRLARLYRLIGTAPNQAKLFAFLPVLKGDATTLAKYDAGSTVTIGAVQYTSAGISPEDLR